MPVLNSHIKFSATRVGLVFGSYSILNALDGLCPVFVLACPPAKVRRFAVGLFCLPGKFQVACIDGGIVARIKLMDYSY